MLHHINLSAWVSEIGFWGLMLVIFVETGFFVGFFLPGDSLVIAAGLLAAKGVFNINTLVPSLVLAAILGYWLAYYFGKYLGKGMMKMQDRWWFKKHYLIEAKSFYREHGGLAMIIGRFIPIVRTFVPIVAGLAQMKYWEYMLYNVVGGVLWGGVLCLVGYALGRLVPNGANYFFPIILLIIFFSLLPIFIKIVQRLRRRRKIRRK